MKADLSTFQSYPLKLFVACILFCQALGAATITGRVADSGTGGYLPGANVVLEGTAYGTASDRAGEYRIMNVPPGSYTLNVTYIGYEDFSIGITVPDEDVTQDIQLQATYVELGEVVVQGLRQGQAKALSQQRSSDHIMNVVSSDQMQRFPDLNVAESLQRIPGLSVQRDQGEGRYVIVRGMEARLNSMKINGQRIPSPESAIRNPALDVIPSNQLASVEVTKALTPDMDGDAIGGAVNLVTKNAFDYGQRVLNFSLGGGYKNLRGNMPYQGAFTFADKFMDGKLGLLVSGSYSTTGLNGTDNIEMEWGDAYEWVTNEIDEWEVEDGDSTAIYVVEEADGTVLNEMELRHYIVKRSRLGVSGSLHYKLNDRNTFYLQGIHNVFSDDEQRNSLGFKIDKAVDEEEPGWGYESVTESGATVIGVPVERELKDRIETQTIASYTIGGDHKFPKLELDWMANYSYAEEDENPNHYYTFAEEEYELSYDITDHEYPQITASSPDYNVLTGFELDVFEKNGPKMQTDEDMTFALNVKIPYTLGSAVGAFKFGGKYLSKATDKDYTHAEFYEMDDVVMSDYQEELEDKILDDNYDWHHTVATEEFRDFWEANKTSFDMEPDLEYKYFDSFTASEQITAAYGMTDLRFGDLMVLAGGRLEMTTTDYNSHVGDLDNEASFRDTSGGKDYTDFLPMVHLRYGLNDRTILRAAYTMSLARPNYEHLTPYRITEDEELSMGNPDLDNTISSNLDFIVEYYVGTLGILSGGFFQKTLTDYIYEKVTEYDPPEDGIEEMTQPMNGEEATLTGFEINWQQQLTFLPGPLSGLGVYINYTNTQSEANYFDREPTTLPGQAEHVANFALSYENYGFAGQISVNYHGELIDEVGSDADDDRIYDARTQVDFSATYSISPTLTIFCDAVNLTNARERYYQGRDDWPAQRELYGFGINAGLKVNF